MVKGYWLVRVDVSDQEKFMAYVKANAKAFEKYDAHFLVRAGNSKVVEGSSRSRNTVIEFPSYQMALDCWHSPEYQEAASVRTNACEIDIVVIEGYDGPQPNFQS